MSYTILKSNGDTLTQIVDGLVDNSTDLTLIGKNAPSYGTYLNENFVFLLENFANTSAPSNPIIGQLWYDSSTNRLKVYDGNLFRVSGGAIVSPTIPAQLATGDLWIDSTNQQMYFNDGTANVLAGPIYSRTQGLSGFQTGTLVDIYSVDHTVLFLYLKKTIVGIYSLEAFTPLVPPTGFTTISIGFTASTIAGLTFNVQSKSATTLIAADGASKTAENFINTGITGPAAVDYKQTTTSQLIIANPYPLTLGPAQNSQILADSSKFNLIAKTQYQNFGIYVNPNGVLTGAVYVNSTTQQVGIFTTTPAATLDVNGNATIRGNLTLTGTSLVITTPTTPASKTASGIAGQVSWDSSYIYICVATNTWKRVAISNSGW
jgi:hypothetical protein